MSDRDDARGRAHPQAERILAAFAEVFGGRPDVLVRAPGRLNLIGSHVDHQEGWVLPGAIDRGVWLAARRTDRDVLRLRALDLEASHELPLADLESPVGKRSPAWWDYPAGVARCLVDEGRDVPALEVVYGGDLPREVGVSSSAAVEVAFLLAWREVAAWPLQRREMALLGRRVENVFLGIGSGVMDQFASLHGREGRLLLLDCRSLEHEEIRFPSSLRLLVFDSGIRRQLARSDYNSPQEDCRAALDRIRGSGFALRSLRDLDGRGLAEVASLLTPRQERRVRHVVEECERVLAAAASLREEKLEAFGTALAGSHASSRDLWEVSLPELDLLVASAREVPACWGARLSGAGLGGCVLAVVGEEGVEETRRHVEASFEKTHGRRPDSFLCRIDEGAEVL